MARQPRTSRPSTAFEATVAFQLSGKLAAALEAKSQELGRTKGLLICQALVQTWGLPAAPADLRPRRARSRMTPFDVMLEKYNCTRAKIVAALNVSRAAIDAWALDKNRPAAEKAIQVELMLGVPRWELRPDLWDRPIRKQRAKNVAALSGGESNSRLAGTLAAAAPG